MRALVALSVTITVAALCLEARPIAAQQMRLASRTTRAAEPTLTDAPANVERLLATYNFGNRPRSISFPSLVTVADSAGTVVARASLVGERRDIPLTVTIMGSDLVLQGQTDDGVLTLVLENQNDAGAKDLNSGRWILGSSRGTLRLRPKN